MTVQNILDAVSQSNMIDSPGLLENNHTLSLALVTGQTKTPDEIGNIVLKSSPAGVPVRIGDVADVRPSVMPVYTIVTANGKPAVLLNIFRQPDSNTVTVADGLLQTNSSDIRKILPPGVKLHYAVLRSVDPGAGIDCQRARCNPGWSYSGGHHSCDLPSRLG